MEELKKALTQRGLGEYFERTKHLVRNAIHIEPIRTPSDQIPVGASKFGGHPDLPEDFVWPRREEGQPLLFLCQYNLAELAPYDRDGLLPTEGILYFFYDVGPMPDISWMELDGWAVRYHAGGAVTRRPGPEDVPGYFATAKLEYTAKPEVPFLFCDLVPRESLQGNEFWDLWDWNNQHASKDGDPSDISTKLLGHACPVQTYGMELECEKAHRKLYGTAGCRWEDPKDHRNAERWVNLLQLDSWEKSWIWDNGYGRVYFWIEEEDLKHRRFDRVLVVTQYS